MFTASSSRSKLDITRRVQQGLLPSPKNVPRKVELAAECVPAGRVGGDFYDLLPLDRDGVALVLGDVSGKGIPAALLMGVIHGAVRSGSWTESALRHEEFSSQLNRLLCERTSGERYASMFWSYYDPQYQLLHYINAGHCPPLLVTERNDRPGILTLDEGGPVLGLLPAARYQQGTVRLRPGDLLVLYSDGVVEAANPSGEEFGEERFCELVQHSLDKSSDDIRREVLSAIQAFVGPAPLHDDLTLLLVRFQP